MRKFEKKTINVYILNQFNQKILWKCQKNVQKMFVCFKNMHIGTKSCCNAVATRSRAVIYSNPLKFR